MFGRSRRPAKGMARGPPEGWMVSRRGGIGAPTTPLSGALLCGVLALYAGMAACEEAQPTTEPDAAGPVTVSDATAEDSTDAESADGGPPSTAFRCCKSEGAEDCSACYLNIGKCCYQDPSILSMGPYLAARCSTWPACRSCCNECASATCEQLLAWHSCPNE